MSTVRYLTQTVAETRRTDVPRHGVTRLGYSVRSGAPTDTLVRLDGEKLWRRVYVWQFSNLGTRFVRVKGEPLVIPTGTILP